MPDTQIKDSIFHDVKQMLGQEWDDPTYDVDIRVHINSVFFDLNQIGVGPRAGFTIMDENALWDSYIGASDNLQAVKSYIFMRVKLLFDPPTNGFLVTSMQQQLDKMEWRLMVECDPIPSDGTEEPITSGDIDGMFS